MPALKISFEHGLGDCVHIAHLLKVYQRFGYEFELGVERNKRWLFETAGFRCVDRGGFGYPDLAYSDPVLLLEADYGHYWRCNKTVIASQMAPLPVVASMEDMWSLLCCWPKIDYRTGIHASVDTVRSALCGMSSPIVLINVSGATNNDRKRIPYEVTRRICEVLMYEGCSVAVVDGPAPVTHPKCRALPYTLFRGNTPNWVALLSLVDVLVGIDSGPFHLARYTGTKAIAYCPTAFHFPSRFCLPDDNHRYAVPVRFSAMAAAVRRDYRIACWDEDPAETIIKQVWGLLG
jgi:hypothetical protein